MAVSGVQFEVVMESSDEAQTMRDDIVREGGSAEVKEEGEGVLPVAVLLWVAIPPGLALLAQVVDRIVHGWRDDGTLIDAREDGPAKISKQDGLPFGTVIILTKDGEESKRTDLSEVDVATYVGKALEAVSGGASATEADQEASKETNQSTTENSSGGEQNK